MGSPSSDYALCFSALYHSSPDMIQDPQVHARIFAMGDGYGNLSPDQLTEMGLWFDWSHIRDSSDAAISRMASAIRRLS